jgi:hypothetical protein
MKNKMFVYVRRNLINCRECSQKNAPAYTYLFYLKSDFNERYIKLKGSKSTTINWIINVGLSHPTLQGSRATLIFLNGNI